MNKKHVISLIVFGMFCYQTGNAQITRHSKGNSLSRWYNLGYSAVEYNNIISPFAWHSPLFPDTLVWMESQGKYSKANYHQIATILDPTHPYFDKIVDPNQQLYINDQIPYRFDSIGFYYKYKRHSSTTIPDTLIVHTFALNTAFKYLQWTGSTASKFNTDTLKSITIKYNPATHYPYLENISLNTQKILLEPEDTSKGLLDIYAGGIDVIAGQWVGVIISFKPGYVYSAGDTITSLNEFRFYSWEEFGPLSNTYPTYIKNDWNCSYIANNQTIADPTSSWYQYFLPVYMMDQFFYLEYHDIDFLLSANTSESIDESPSMQTYQVFPNPCNEAMYVNALNSNQAETNYSLKNLYGQLIAKGHITHSTQNINTQQLLNGIYLLELYTKDRRWNKKIVVQH